MLRHHLSSGMLRARAQSASPSAAASGAAAHPPVPLLPKHFSTAASTTTSTSQATASAPGSRGLASSVLLSSREESWQGRTVKGLKEALSQRGLAVTGNKLTLVQRLQAFESAQQGLSTVSAGSASANATAARRSISSSPAPRKSSKTPGSSSAKSTTDPTATSPGATRTSTAAVTDAAPPTAAPTPSDPDALVPPDVKVNDLRAAPGMPQGTQGDGAAAVADAAESVDESAAPGLPDSGAGEERGKRRVQMAWQMPAYEEVSEQLAVPPFTPDAFHSTAEQSMSPPAEPASQAPKVMTVASASTHADAPTHGLHETFDHDSAPADAEGAEESAKEKAKEAQGALTSLGLGLPSLKTLRVDLSALPVALPSLTAEAVGDSKGGKGKGKGKSQSQSAQSAHFEPITRPMDAEERRGAYILLGVVLGGLFLGGGRKSAEEKERARREKEERKREKEGK